jgi:hypothetical protein
MVTTVDIDNHVIHPRQHLFVPLHPRSGGNLDEHLCNFTSGRNAVAAPAGKKEQAIYHMILAEMHRVRALLLNLQTIETEGTEQSLREHFTREQNGGLGKLSEWKQRRPQIYRQAYEDFQQQTRAE